VLGSVKLESGAEPGRPFGAKAEAALTEKSPRPPDNSILVDNCRSQANALIELLSRRPVQSSGQSVGNTELADIDNFLPDLQRVIVRRLVLLVNR